MNYFNNSDQNITINLTSTFSSGTGIILKSFMPHKQSFSIFDSKIGKVLCYWDTKKPLNFRPGFLVSYSIRLKNGYYILSNLEVINFPYDLINKNLELLHFILELCDYFLPLHNASGDLFDFLNTVYEGVSNFSTAISIKSFLFRFLTLLNLYPKDFLLENAIRDVIFSSKLRAGIKEENLHLLLDNWLLGCMRDNEFYDRIKSFKFLKELGIYE